LCVRDTGVGLGAGTLPARVAEAANRTAFGLSQVRERLHVLYGDRASFVLDTAPDDEGGVLACITLPLDALPP
jgi:sensor histidine kinase YesM